MGMNLQPEGRLGSEEGVGVFGKPPIIVQLSALEETLQCSAIYRSGRKVYLRSTKVANLME
jgi:hypothetical protein